MMLNPIIAREVRVRWRTWGSPALVLLLLTGLALAMGAAYADQTNIIRDTQGRSAQGAGRAIFMVLAFMQMGAWLILSPVLTSMNIAAERERGLLENLQLSPLRASQIAGGKLFSAAAFIVLVSITALPVTGITFFMGGVSPNEFFGVGLLNLLTALCGASIGLFFSARCRRPLPALLLSMLTVAIWFFGAFLMAAIAEGAFASTPPPPPASAWRDLAGWATFFNPMLSLYALMEPGGISGPGFSLPGPLGFPYWTIFPCFAPLLSAFCIWGAARAVRRPFEPAYPNDRHWLSYMGRRSSQVRHAAAGTTGGAGELGQPAPLEVKLLREIRIDQWVRFTNPVLQREVRGPFRFRRAKAWQGITQLFVAAVALGLLLYSAFAAWDDSNARNSIWDIFLNLWLFAIIATAAVWSARSFARERENGLFEGLWLSMLTPREVVRAKVLAPLIVIAVYSLPILVILALSLDWMTLYGVRGYYNSVPVTDGVGAILIAFTTVFFVITFGLYVSFRSNRVTNAVITVMVTLLIAWCAGPVFLQSVLSVIFGNTAYSDGDKLLHLLHPFVAINDLHSYPYDGDYQPAPMHPNLISWSYILVAASGGATFYVLLLGAMENRMRLTFTRPVPSTVPEA